MLLAIGIASCAESTEPKSRDSGSASSEAHFSFFVTSLAAIQQLSESQNGFGGDLRFGESGAGAGLRGADKICTTIAEASQPGATEKTWRAFLSATAGEDGEQVNAIDRIGDGPWYDRLGRLFAMTRQDLISARPTGADSTIVDDFPNEDGVPNHAPDPAQGQVDNHDTLTGTNSEGQLYGASATCADWTSTATDGSTGRPRVGHSWVRGGAGGAGPGSQGGGRGSRMQGGQGSQPPFLDADGGFAMFGPGGGARMFGSGGGGMRAPGDGMGIAGPGGIDGWMSSLDEAGCGPGVSIVEMGPPNTAIPTVGSGGGYGGIYCFALSP